MKYLGVWGVHSEGREYGYHGRSILDEVPANELPWFPDADIFQVCDLCEEIMRAHGLVQRSPEGGRQGYGAKQVFDLKPEMVFTLSDGDQMTLAELEDHARVWQPLRLEDAPRLVGYATLWDPDSTTPDRVHVLIGVDRVCFARFQDRDHAPVETPGAAEGFHRPDGGADGAAREAAGRTVMTNNNKPMPACPGKDAPLLEKIDWLLQTHGYCELLDKVVKLYEASDQCLLAPLAFARSRRAWNEATKGKRGALKIIYATSIWEMHPTRRSIRGIRMRPDMPFPTYQENGELFKNTYLRPVHTGEGNVQTFLDFMVHLIPDEFERNWFLDWLAHKWVKPEIPGIAVVMVASDIEGQIFGTGRGMLRDIVQRLLGRAYARPLNFDVLTGKSAQGVYTDWLAGVILVMVDEAKDTPDSGRWSERRAVFERLKEIIDPRVVERAFQVKWGQQFYGLCFAGFLIATNNLDAIQIPAGDRRFGVLANGGRMQAEMAKKLQTWMDQPGNIAELARWLEARDLRAFDPFEAPETLTKSVMQELARSERDEAFITVRRRLGKGALFTGEQILRAMQQEVGAEVARREDFMAWVRHRVRAAATAYDEEFRMPRGPDGKRAYILRWRDYDGPVVKKVEDAQGQVGITEKIIGAETEAQAAALRKWRVLHGEGWTAAGEE